MVIYYIYSILALIVSLFFFHGKLTINAASVAVISIIVTSIIQACTINIEEDETYISIPTERELDIDAYKLAKRYHVKSKLITIPLLLPFVIYFPWGVKIAVCLSVYLIGYIVVPIIIRVIVKNKRDTV